MERVGMTMRSHWRLNPEIDFLNHGSFGATPSVVLEEQSRLRDELERDPIRFLAPERELEPKLDRVRCVLSALVGAESANLAFVRNATDGVNAVIRSFPLRRRGWSRHWWTNPPSSPAAKTRPLLPPPEA